jgi:hypothetical protein
LISCAETEKQKQKRLEKERIAFVKDSIAKREAFVKDSIATAQRIQDSIKNAEIIRTHKNLFKVNGDDFSNIKWYKHKNTPRYIVEKGIFLYFGMTDNTPTILRFKYQYSASDWLFIKEMIFNIDGEIFNVIPDDMKRDCNRLIWEWYDTYVVNNNAGITQRFIEKLINAKQAKVKLVGSQYSEVITITPKQIKAMKQTYDYYKALGGKI